jgi:hypothetical protein
MDGIHKFIPLGYRCTSSSILRKMGLKLESYPFDWLVSRLDVVLDCLDSDFQEFKNLDDYERRETLTHSVQEDGSKVLITKESILVNKFYQPKPPQDPLETYQYNLALTHHDILVPKMYDYMMRCIDRFKNLLESDIRKIAIHIEPIQFESTFTDVKKEQDIKKCVDFHAKFSGKTS